MESHRQRAAWAAGTAAAVLLVFAPAVVGLRTLSRRDTDRLFAPVRTLVVEELRSGRLPLWNPHEGTGKPLFAEGFHSVLHPVSLLGAAVAPSSIDFLILAYLVAAALGAFVLARTLGASLPASSCAGLAFALSGYSTSMTGNLLYLAGLSALPWPVAAARAAGAGARWGPVAVALATACAFLTGEAQVAGIGVALGVLLAAEAGGPRGVGRALGGVVAGALLAGVQIAATLEILPRTMRSVELSPWEKVRWSLPPARLLEFVVPGLFGGPLDAAPAAASGASPGSVFAESVFLGAPLLAAAALALRSRRRTALLLGGAALALLWLALGHHLGARQLLDWVPVWKQFRYSEKLMAPLTLCACALGGLGVDAFHAAAFSQRWRRSLAAAMLVAGTVLLALHLAPETTQGLAVRLLGDTGAFYRATLAAGLPHLVVGLGALLVVDRLRDGSLRALALSVVIAVACAAAVRYGAHMDRVDQRGYDAPLHLDSDSPSPRVTQPTPPLEHLRESRAFLDACAEKEPVLLFPAYNVAYRIDALGHYGLDPRRITTLLKSLHASPALIDRDLLRAAVTAHQGYEAPTPARARSLRRFGLTHALFPIPADGATPEFIAPVLDGGRLVERDRFHGVEIWALPHRPWAFFPRRVVAREQPPDAHRVLLELMDRADDETVVVEAGEPLPASAGRVLRAERGTRSVRVEATSEEAGLLVVQDAWWPGWRASIDGQPAEILIADILVRAVRWPPGRHTLEMTYDPPGVRAGLALTTLGGVLVLLLAALALRRGRGAPVDGARG
jgi:hypothetical protein